MKYIPFVLILFVACSEPSDTTVEPSTQAPPPAVTETMTVTTGTTTQTTGTEPPVSPALPTEKGPKLRPVDEAPQDPTFAAFRERLRDAVRRRDAKYLLSTLHPNIRTSFGGDGGIEEFKKRWTPENPNAKIWTVMDDILRLGGSFREVSATQKSFCAPYVFSTYPDSGPDPYSALVVIEPNTLLLDKPNGQPIARLDSDILTIVQGAPEYSRPESEWRKVTTASGKTGFVASKSVRMHLDYRACFDKINADWKMMLLVAGD